MELFEIEEEHNVRREEAADMLRQIADSLSRHNSLEFLRSGLKFTVDVADEVEVEIELEVGDDNKLEIEISW